MTRAATSQGDDLDTWMADFGLARMPPSKADGLVTFGRYTQGFAALIPPGVVVATLDGAQNFIVQKDTTNAAWSDEQGGYVLAAGIAAVTVPAAASIAGAAGNVQAGAVGLLTQAVPGVDSVTNAAAFAGGLDAEIDADLRIRFQNFLATRGHATRQAVAAAIAGVRQGLNWTITENQPPGSFLVTVDDGTGAPTAELLSQVAAAVEPIRPIGTNYAVQGPKLVTANVSITISTTAGIKHVLVAAAVQEALRNEINTLPIGGSLALTRLAQWAYAVDPGILNVTTMMLNNETMDLVAPADAVIKAGQIVVN